MPCEDSLSVWPYSEPFGIPQSNLGIDIPVHACKAWYLKFDSARCGMRGT
jgi:hypothetical protein